MATTELSTDVDTTVKVAMRPPNKFNVILYNDDGTTVEFVVLVLMTVFYKSFQEANSLTWHIHENGSGIAGTYSHEIAVQKREETLSAARANGYPLRCEVKEST